MCFLDDLNPESVNLRDSERAGKILHNFKIL